MPPRKGVEGETTAISRARPRAVWRGPRVRLWLGACSREGVDERHARSRARDKPALKASAAPPTPVPTDREVADRLGAVVKSQVDGDGRGAV